jgi:type IV pilus assembly protein PilB
MATEKNKTIFDMLRERGLFSMSTQKMAVGFMEQWSVDAFRAVIETHLVEESKIADILCDELKLPRLARVRTLQVEKDVFEFIAYDVALEQTIFPFELKTDGTLKVAFADPSSRLKLEKIQELASRPIEPYIAERSEIISAIQRHYPLSKQLPSLVSKLQRGGVQS